MRLLRIDQSATLATGATIASILWADESGEVIRSEMHGLHQVSYRTDRTTAEAAAKLASFDLGQFSTVRVARSLPNPHSLKRVRYRISMPTADPANYFRPTDGQSVARIDDHAVEVTVKKVLPPLDGETRNRSDRSDQLATSLAPSALIQSDDDSVVQIAAQLRSGYVKSDIADPSVQWQLARKVERFVYGAVEKKDFSTAFASAAEVARRLQGDCTEHAVLVAAICRACDLPARILIGLVYVPSQQAFVFHMWNEVHIANSWIPLDATLGQSGTGAAHLILERNDLATGDAFTAFLPVLGVIGQLEIDVIEVLE